MTWWFLVLEVFSLSEACKIMITRFDRDNKNAYVLYESYQLFKSTEPCSMDLAQSVFQEKFGRNPFVVYQTNVNDYMVVVDAVKFDEEAGYLLMARNCLPEHQTEAMELQEKAIQLIEGFLENDGHCPALFRVLGMAYFELGRLADAEKVIKSSLLRDGSNAQAWYLLALLRTATQDYEGALEICNIQLDQQSHPDLDLCFLKTAILSYFDQGDEAIELTKAIFSYWVCKSETTGGMSAFLGLLTPEPSSSGPTSGDAETDSAVTMRRFRQRFVGKPKGDLPSLTEQTTILRFTEIANRFPRPAGETKCSLLGLTSDTHFFSVKERLSLHHWVQYGKVQEGGKRFGIAKELWLWLSKLYLADRVHHEAELATMAAFAVDELCPQVYYRLGRVFEAQGRTSEAIETFEKGLQVDPDHPGCHLGLARQYLNLGFSETSKCGLAFSHANAVIHISPKDSRAMHLMAEIYKAVGQDEQAGSWYKRALEAQDKSPHLPISPHSFLTSSF